MANPSLTNPDDRARPMAAAPGPVPKQYTRVNGRRGLEEMRDIIASGRSVLHDGEILTKVEHLPDEATMAAGDPESERAVLEKIDTQMAALQRQREYLGTPMAERAPSKMIATVTTAASDPHFPGPANSPAATAGADDEARREAARRQREALMAPMRQAADDADARAKAESDAKAKAQAEAEAAAKAQADADAKKAEAEARKARKATAAPEQGEAHPDAQTKDNPPAGR